MTQKLNIEGSLNTSTLNQDIVPMGPDGPMLENTGIERLGGVTNLEETVTALSSGDNAFTRSGKNIRMTTAGAITVDGEPIGTVSTTGVKSRQRFTGYADACLAQDGTGNILAIQISGKSVIYHEIDTAGTIINTRTITWTNDPGFVQATAVAIIRTQSIAFADSLELMVRRGESGYVVKESSLTEVFANPLQGFEVAGTTTGGVLLYKGWVLVVGTGGIASWDGYAWRYADGTGAGTGFNISATDLGFTPRAAIVYTDANGEKLVVAGSGGQIKTVDGLGVQFNDATGTNMGGNQINTIANLGGRLFFAGVGGRVCSCNSSGTFTAYNAAGTGTTAPANNGTVIGAVEILCSEVYGTRIAFAGISGRLGSWDGTAWNNYTSGTGLANNGTVIGVSNILAMTNYSGSLVVAGVGGRLGSWNGTAWTNYTAGSGLSNNATVVGASDIEALIVTGSTLVVFGRNSSTSRYGSWNGSAWNNYNSGTGQYAGINVRTTSAVIYGSIIVTSGDLYTNNITATTQAVWATGINGTGLFSKATTLGQVYAFRYANGQLLVMIQGDPRPYNTNVVSALPGGGVTANNGRYVVKQTQSGYTRHLLTGEPTVSINNLYAVSYLGYVAFDATFSTLATANRPVLQNLINSVTSYNIGYGYADIISDGTAGDWLTVWPSPFDASTIGRSVLANTNTLAGMYGKLTNLPGVAPGTGHEIRIGQINGTQGFLSVAVIDSGITDTLGTLLTAPGELDDTFCPEVATISTSRQVILYRFNGEFRTIELSSTVNSRFEQVNDRIMAINTISPVNGWDDYLGRLIVTNSDYNGRMIFESNVAPALTSTLVVSKFYTDFSNGIDVGEKQVQITGVSRANIILPGVRLPVDNANIPNYGIDTYIAGLYSFTTLGNLSELVDPAKVDTLYLQDSTLPLPIGMSYAYGSAQYYDSTFYLDSGRVTFTVGNDFTGLFTVFQLFGQTYACDDYYIYLVETTGGILGARTPIAPKAGLRFLAVSPTAAYFYSSWDISLYSFNGGRSLDKGARFTAVGAINSGIWSELENTLALDQDDYIIWIRDGVISRMPKPVAMTTADYYSTTQGIKIIGGSNAYQYSLFPTGTSAPVPLNIKTAYYGPDANVRQVLKNFVVTLYSSTSSAISVNLTVKGFDQDAYYEQTEAVNLQPSDYNAEGYARIRIQPANQRLLGASCQVDTTSRCVVVDVTADYELEVVAPISTSV